VLEMDDNFNFNKRKKRTFGDVLKIKIAKSFAGTLVA